MANEAVTSTPDAARRSNYCYCALSRTLRRAPRQCPRPHRNLKTNRCLDPVPSIKPILAPSSLPQARKLHPLTFTTRPHLPTQPNLTLPQPDRTEHETRRVESTISDERVLVHSRPTVKPSTTSTLSLDAPCSVGRAEAQASLTWRSSLTGALGRVSVPCWAGLGDGWCTGVGCRMSRVGLG